tara:strand:- start:1271 stop:1879 length:609 start_codon:yes stop_codon:yes gene_type:complete
MKESYLEKRQRILKEQKKRKAQRDASRKKTIGPETDIVKNRAKKSRSSKLGSAQPSKGSKNPTSMFQNMKKKDVKKSTFFEDVIAGPKLKKKKLGKVDVGLSEAMKRKKPMGMSPGALGGKAKPKAKTFRDYKTIAAAKKAGSLYYMGKDGKKKAAVTKADLDKSGLSLRDYMNFMTGKTRKPTKKKMSYGGVSLKPKKKMM